MSEPEQASLRTQVKALGSCYASIVDLEIDSRGMIEKY